MQIVCHARSLDHTSKMFCQLDILKIYDLIDFNTCIFYVQSVSQISSFDITKQVFNVIK